MTVTCNYRSTAVIILPGVYLPPQRNATVADDAFSLLFISIHAPREGSDVLGVQVRCYHDLFQSTLPARGATRGGRLIDKKGRFQSTLPARGATRGGRLIDKKGRFQSTLPARGATVIGGYCRDTLKDFNPRSPRGERPRAKLAYCSSSSFQSTLPARGATSSANESW